MPQLYIFIASVLATAIIVTRRHFLFTRHKKREFKKEISTRVDVMRQEEQENAFTSAERFKETHIKEKERQKFDLKKYKDEMRRAEMAISREQWSEAKKILIQALSMTDDEVPASLKLAKVYLESDDLKKAETLYRRLLELDQSIPEIYVNLGVIFTKKKRFREAVQAYARATELDEKDDSTLLALGKLYFLLMRYSLAAECFRRAAELRPREVGYLFLLADACRLDDDLDNALFTYEKILTIEPYNEKAKNEASNLRMKMKEGEVIFS